MNTLPCALSSDELRAAARLAGLAPPPAFDPGWAPEELGVADAVAVRGLMARGLAEIRDNDVALTASARSALDPLLAPEALVEIHQDETAAGRRGHLLGESANGLLLAAERSPSIWDLRAVEKAVPALLAIAGPLVPAYAPAAGGPYTVGGDALDRTETLLAQGGAAHVPEALRGGGLGAADAAALAGVLAAMTSLVTVRAVRRTGDTNRTADALTWLDAGPAGLWTVAPGDDDATYTITAADHETVHAALTDLLTGALEEQPCLMS